MFHVKGNVSVFDGTSENVRKLEQNDFMQELKCYIYVFRLIFLLQNYLLVVYTYNF